MMGSYIVLILFAFLAEGVFGDKDEVMSVMKGDRVTLNTGVIKTSHDIFRWYFEDTLIAQINGHPEKSCLYDGKDEIFKDSLDMDYKTGSLIITNSQPEHTGRYEAEFIKYDNTGKSQNSTITPKCDNTKIHPKGRNLVINNSFKLTVSAVPDSGVSPGEIAGIIVGGVLLLAAAAVGVMIYLRRRSRNDIKKNKQNEPDQVSGEKLIV